MSLQLGIWTKSQIQGTNSTAFGFCLVDLVNQSGPLCGHPSQPQSIGAGTQVNTMGRLDFAASG